MPYQKLFMAVGIFGSLIMPVASRSAASYGQETPAPKNEWKSLFDGTSLDGWRGKPELWTVEDGAITGTTSSEAPLKNNSFLIWEGGNVTDFELKVKFRIHSGNSGIQFRSRDVSDFMVAGYQADIDAENRFTGILYQERLRGIIAKRGQQLEINQYHHVKELGKTCTEEEFREKVNIKDWNEFKITARGSHIILSINGVVTVDVVDEDPLSFRDGILALQLHTGPPMKVQFKDIYLRDLSR